MKDLKKDELIGDQFYVDKSQRSLRFSVYLLDSQHMTAAGVLFLISTAHPGTKPASLLALETRSREPKALNVWGLSEFHWSNECTLFAVRLRKVSVGIFRGRFNFLSGSNLLNLQELVWFIISNCGILSTFKCGFGIGIQDPIRFLRENIQKIVHPRPLMILRVFSAANKMSYRYLANGSNVSYPKKIGIGPKPTWPCLNP